MYKVKTQVQPPINPIRLVGAPFTYKTLSADLFPESMATKKPKNKPPQDIDALKHDVASFASSIGLSTSVPPVSSSSAGFDDSDFRKTGRLNPQKQTPPNPRRNKSPPHKKQDGKKNNHTENTKLHSKLKSQQGTRVLSNVSSDKFSNKAFDKFKNSPKLPLVKPDALGVWYVDAVELEKKVIGSEGEKKIEITKVEDWKRLVEKKKELGERLFVQYVQDYESSRGKNGDIKMLVATQRSGTAADKVSAYSVMVGDNPVANLKSIDALLGLVTSKVGKRHSLTGFEVLRELFVSNLLPDRKLKTLLQRPVNLLPETRDGYSLLLFWYWEECLKQRYERFVSALEEASRDVLAILKDKALKTIYVLLKSKPEQERRLLSAMVNKLGDPGKKAASNADFHLSKLLADHPTMKAVVIDEVDNFLFRPHLGLQAKFYAVNFLSQIRLAHKGDGPKVAKRLIDVYFALFKLLISETNGQVMDKNGNISNSKHNKVEASSESQVGMDSRLLTALLTGVNRAFPFVSTNEADEIIESQTPMLFQLVHSRSFNVGVQALMLLDKISSKNQIVSDRFYRALYAKLLLPAVMNSSKEEMFFGLLLRAMKNDINLKRVAAFSKRLLQVALQQPPQYACGCLFLLSEVLKARPPLWNTVLQNETTDEDLEHFEDVKEDDENQAVAAQNKMNLAANARDGDSTSAESDSPLSEDGSVLSDSEIDPSDEGYAFLLEGSVQKSKQSNVITDRNGEALQAADNRALLPGGYNPRHREALYCNADRVSWWELAALASHIHPSVATMARTILSGANIVYNGNPLNDFSLNAFLDKFKDKKPKQSTWHGASQIEPAKKLDMKNRLIGAEILSLAETDVPPEDLVFHRFYTNKMDSSKVSKKKKKKKKTADDEDAEELYAIDGQEDESDNEEIENLLDSGDPSLEANGDYDYDDLDDVVNEEDNDLIGHASDEEMDISPKLAINEYSDLDSGDDKDSEDNLDQQKRKRKRSGQTAKSPFASMEDYEHLINKDPDVDPTKKKKQHRRKKKRTSN